MRPLSVLPILLLAIAFLIVPSAIAVKRNDFKTCSQSGFCRRLRSLSSRKADSPSWTSPYIALPPSNPDTSAHFIYPVRNRLAPEGIKFELDVRVHKDGGVRVRMDEVDGLRKRYDEAASWAILNEPEIHALTDVEVESTQNTETIRFGAAGADKDLALTVTRSPLHVALTRGKEVLVELNGQQLLHMEHYRKKDQPETVEGEEAEEKVVVQPIGGDDGEASERWAWPGEQPFEDPDTNGLWEETFSGKRDTKPKGPEALSLDITFPSHAHVFGIPEHAAPLSLPPTDGTLPPREMYAGEAYTDPYRLWNLDVFEYEPSSSMALYGAVPLLHAHSARSTVSVLFLSASETWIDVTHPTPSSTATHWIAESGILDLFILPGPTPLDTFKQYADLTGTAPLPQLFAIGHHQCRWNYLSSRDVLDVVDNFDKADVPVDVIWLDIEYAEEHKYFIWDKKNFPDPKAMLDSVAATGRQMVAIIDPHIKRTDDLHVYKEAKEHDILVKNADGQSEYEGWCWTGSSSWVDFFNPKSWDWWIGMFDFKKWTDSSKNLWIWNDMNEPSVFNGPEITMPKDNIFHGGWEHRDIHNINGMLFQNVTSQALIARQDPPRRPFVLSRSYYAGSQRFGAIWTGDNLGTWDHLKSAAPMVLSNNIAGIVFSGADVGGFFGNPGPEFLVRWYQAGAFHPFFRAHAHIDTKRREPYLLDQPYQGLVRDAIRLRYGLLPAWYTAFHESSRTGLPVASPQYVVFPKDEAGFDVDDQYFVGGSGLLVKPVVEEGAKETTVYLADDEPYYDYFTHALHLGSLHKKHITVPTPLEAIPLFHRGGSILPQRTRIRRAAPLMNRDPLTLVVALSKDRTAEGEVYLDDGETFEHERGAYIWRRFAFAPRSAGGWTLSSEDADPERKGGKWEDGKEIRVERVVVLGLETEPRAVKVGGRDVEWSWTPGAAAKGRKEGRASELVLKDPKVFVAEDWQIEIA